MTCHSTLSPDTVVIEALFALPYRKELQVDSPRTRCVRKFAEELSTILRNNNPELQAKFQAFAKELYTSLKSIMEVSQPSTMVKLRGFQHFDNIFHVVPFLWRKL